MTLGESLFFNADDGNAPSDKNYRDHDAQPVMGSGVLVKCLDQDLGEGNV